jgi:uncharacterized protein
MTVFEVAVFTLLGGVVAGMVGSLTGLGGGVVIVPLLTLALGVNIRYAIGASLIAVIATSSGAAAAYVREGFTNLRVGMFLEVATTSGALIAASISGLVSAEAIALVFGAVLLASVYFSLRSHEVEGRLGSPDPLATRLRMNGTYPVRSGGRAAYHVRRVPGGFALMFVAGCLSGLLGIGSGALKVLAMDMVMRMPLKVSTTTSNFMIGVTAAASAGVYLRKGYIDPALAMPVMLGVLAGSVIGARFLARARTRVLRILFEVVILLLGLEMIYSALTGKF